MALVITVKYQSRPNSNVGAYVAKALGKQRSLVDQSLSPRDQSEGAAQLLLDALIEEGYLLHGATLGPEIGPYGSGRYGVDLAPLPTP